MTFMIEDDDALVKYNNIWNKINEMLSMKFHSMPVYNEKFIKTEIKKIRGVANTDFWLMKYQKKVLITLV